MGLLDELKQEADSLKAKERDERERQALLERRFKEHLEPKLLELHAYLKELVEQLNFVKPEVVVEFPLEDSKPLADLRHDSYFLSRYGEGKFFMTITSIGPTKQVFQLFNPKAIEQRKQFFDQHRVKYHCKELKNDQYETYQATFVVQPEIKTILQFVANPKDDTIVLLVQNYAALSTQKHEFEVEKIESGFYDDLGKFLIRRDNGLLERRLERLSAAQREAIRRAVEEDKRKREEELRRIEEAEQARSRSKISLRGLFKKDKDA